jgi:hypothetical protein
VHQISNMPSQCRNGSGRQDGQRIFQRVGLGMFHIQAGQGVCRQGVVGPVPQVGV